MNIQTVYSSEDEYESELREEQIYWNVNDGELLAILEINEGDPGEVLVFDMQTGASDIWSQEDSIFCDECVGSELIPMEHRSGGLGMIPEGGVPDDDNTSIR